MANGGTILVLTCLVTGVYGVMEVKRPVGGSVTLRAVYTETPHEISWKFNGDKVVDFEVGKTTHFYRFKDRADISVTDGLIIRNLSRADSGDYRAEVLIGSNIYPTEIRLTVLDCPENLTVSNRTTDSGLVLTCHSSTPNVKYQWVNKTGVIVQGPEYTAHPSPTEDQTLTCSVSNEVCTRNVSVPIPHTHGNNAGVIAGILIPVLLIIVGALAFFVYRKYKKSTKPGNEEKTPEQGALMERGGSDNTMNDVPPPKEETSIVETGESAEPENVEKTSEREQLVKGVSNDTRNGVPPPEEKTPIVKTGGDPGSGSCDSVDFVLAAVKEVLALTVWRGDNDEAGQDTETEQENETEQDDETYTVEVYRSVGEPTSHQFQLPGQIVDGVESVGRAAVEQSVGRAAVEQSVGGSADGAVRLLYTDGEVRISLADPKDVTEVVWKKGDDILLQWTVGDLQSDKIALSSSSLTINNLEEGDNKSYRVDVKSTDDHVTSIVFRQKVISREGKPPKRTTEIIVTSEPPSSGSEQLISVATEDPPLSITSITLRPNSITEKGHITWKKNALLADNLPEHAPLPNDALLADNLPEHAPLPNDALLADNLPEHAALPNDNQRNHPDQRIHLHNNGDLTLKKVTRADKGKYSVLCDDVLVKEFHLRL